MRGHIRKRGKGNNKSLIVYLGRDPVTGKRKYQEQSFKGTMKEAEKALAKMIVELEQGTYVKPTNMTTAEVMEEWLRNYVSISTSPRTQHRYTEIIRKHLIPALGAIPLTKLQPRQIQSYYTEALESGHRKRRGGLSPQTVQYHHRILFSSLKYAVRQGLLIRNPAEFVDIPRGTAKEITILTPESVNRLLEVAKPTIYYHIFHTAAYTGMRRSELLGLRWCDLNLDLLQPSISVVQTLHQLANGEYITKETKSKAGRRRLALFPSSAILLNEYKESIITSPAETDFVFTQPDGSMIRPNSITRAFSTIAQSIGLNDVKLHDLRHFHATMLLKQGVHPKIVSERLGHSKVAFTLDRYSHVLPGLQEAAGLAFEEGMKTASQNTVFEIEDWQKIGKLTETDENSDILKLENEDGSAWGIRTPDLRLERAVS